MVLATQNPIEYEGTFPLPEAQLDRFLLRLRLGYPSMNDEIKVLDDQQLQHPLELLKSVVKLKEILQAIDDVKQIFISPIIKRYIVELTTRTRQSADVYLGASPRGSLSLARASQARAALMGRDYVLPDDVQALALAVLAHRIIVSPAARLRDLSSDRILQEIIHATPVPGGEFASDPIRKKTK
jgi:MoxR-like ATPase